VPAEELMSGVNWLTIVDDVASSVDFPNRDLGIEGVFYAYGDGCATFEWDPALRCISGEFCAWSESNWGIGIGFDFNNDGTNKYAWNSSSAAATPVKGISWSVHFDNSNTRDFQIWITNMDPNFGGVCAATADCGYAGPPDGESSPSSSGSLMFTSLQKDDWGGTGTNYSFNPANILALQFKMPAPSAPESFYMCVDNLGISL
jgi:hypothetical protein